MALFVSGHHLHQVPPTGLGMDGGGIATFLRVNDTTTTTTPYLVSATTAVAAWSSSGSERLLLAQAVAAAASANGTAGDEEGEDDDDEEEEGPSTMPYTLAQTILIALVATCLSIITVVGNFMVMISFKMDKQLQTISNYFLLSLAAADFAIGLISMPFYTVYLLLGNWPFGSFLCDSWLSLDYLVSNASVLNLLIISFDRYFSVTRPLTYRARRTTRRAIFMISCAWVISLILWPPWIFAWPYIEGRRTVEKHKCYIQFIKTNLYITSGTAIAAFYIPVTVMCGLYWQIWRETEKRQKDLTNLQAVKKDNSKRSTSSDDVVEQQLQLQMQDDDDSHKRSRSDSSATTVQAATTTTVAAAASQTSAGDLEIETTYVPTSMCVPENPRYLKVPGRTKAGGGASSKRTFIDAVCSACLKYCKMVDREPPEYNVEEDSTSDAGGHGSPGNTTPASAETPVQSTVSRCTSLTLNTTCKQQEQQQQQPPSTGAAANARGAATSSRSSTTTGNGVRGVNNVRLTPDASVYTILIQLPLDAPSSSAAETEQPSIRMIAEEELPPPPPLVYHQTSDVALLTMMASRRSSPRFERAGGGGAGVDCHEAGGVVRSISEECGGGAAAPTATGRRISQPPADKLPLNTKLVPKQQVMTTKAAVVKKKKKKTQERKQDRKAAKTLSAILLAFIITWTPYNILVLVQTLATCGDQCVPNEIWDLVYYLCYINSTINPLCYALCNASFRRTYVRILTCKWHTKKRNPNRGFYN